MGADLSKFNPVDLPSLLAHGNVSTCFQDDVAGWHHDAHDEQHTQVLRSKGSRTLPTTHHTNKDVCQCLKGEAGTLSGGCLVSGIFNITFAYLFDMISPIVGSLGH